MTINSEAVHSLCQLAYTSRAAGGQSRGSSSGSVIAAEAETLAATPSPQALLLETVDYLMLG